MHTLRSLRLPTVTPRQSAIAGVTAVVAFVILELILPLQHNDNTGSHHWETPLSVLVLGATIGLTYGLLGVGLVLIYRSNRIINFAHGQIGAFGAALFGLMVTKGHVPYWIALAPALAGTAGVGALAEAAVIRRLRKAPPLMSIVATLGVGQFLLLFAAVFNSQSGAGNLYPQPAGLPHFHIGALLVTPAYFGMLVLSPVVVLAVGAFLKLSKYGLAIRCAASNPENARMTGIFASRMSGLAWAIAAALAAFAAILTAPTQGFTTGDSFGPALLLRALVAAVVARMTSLPIALAAGAALGIVEQLLLWNYPQPPGVVEVALFVIIVLALVLQKQRVGRAEEKGSWAAVQPGRPLPAALRQVWILRNLGLVVGLIALGVFALLPLGITNSSAVTITGIFGFIIVGLSVGIVTGLGGQLSLGQFAIAGCGAVVSYQTVRRSGSYLEGFLYAGLAAAAVSVLIGIPALRIKGLLLTVTTLSFALVVPSYLLQQSWAFGSAGVDPGRPIIFGSALQSGKAFYFVGLGVLLVAMVIARNVRNSGLGRLLISVRDNEDAARAFTVPAARVKLTGFAIAGFLAGIGGAMYGHSLSLVAASSFPTPISIAVVTMTVIGGVGLLSGPLLGSLVVFFIPDFLPIGSTGLATTAFGQLLIILYLPGGLAQLATPIRDRLATAIGQRLGIDVAAAYLSDSSSGAAPDAGRGAVATTTVNEVRAPLPRTAGPGHLLEAQGLRKSFGGVRAVRGVSFGVSAGETLGLIGPNGAGKTTTFELLAGFTRADEGAVRFDGHDVTRLSPEARGRLGLIRSFQDAALFPTLSVTECVQLSLERVEPTRIGTSLLGLTRQERRKQQTARELVAWMGLERYASAQIRELSTGTRRITEIACLVALQPRVLLLDEPSSGVAQRETEALGALLVKLRRQLNLTLVVIEHDIPLIMSLSDRIVAMADGEVIAAGTPDVVRHDPAVVDAYLGGSITAIERSDSSARRKPSTTVAARRRLKEGAVV